MTLKAGDLAPRFSLLSVSGETYSFTPEDHQGHLLLIFLRHLG